MWPWLAISCSAVLLLHVQLYELISWSLGGYAPGHAAWHADGPFRQHLFR